MKVAVDVLKDVVKDLEQLKQSLQETKPADSNDWDQFELEDVLSEFYQETLESDDVPVHEYACKIIDLVTPTPVVVPEFVAEWFEENKNDLEFSIWEYFRFWEDHDDTDDFFNWMGRSANKPTETLIRMKDGYTVEKEPKWIVRTDTGFLSFITYFYKNSYEMKTSLKKYEMETSLEKKEAIEFKEEHIAKHIAEIIGGEVLPVEEEE
ncbi:DUF1642 domain-containing protein [Erwinia sp. CPCC 100877]|nr:DUF1642 domain-containing protein [Erwinia sp. CPCC 100877]